MRKQILFTIFTFLISGNLLSKAQSKPAENDSTAMKIVMFGNSITFQGSWQQELNRTDVLNWGIPGYTSGQLIWTIKNVLVKHKATKIWFIEGGINDLSLGVPPQRVVENQILTIDSLKRNHIIPVIQSTIYQSDGSANNIMVTEVNQKMKAYCVEHNVDYIDLNAFLSPKGFLIKELTTDGCHLYPKAYKPWAEAVAKVLKKYGI